MTRKITVCKSCQDRRIGCHATCERYIKQSEEQDKLQAKINAEKDLYGQFADIVIKSKEKKRKHGKR